jgi:hypothetical protein
VVIVVIGTARVLHELVEASREVAKALRASWQRRRWQRRGSP